MELPSRTRVLIIGGGPAGLTAAIYSARAGLNPVVAAGSVEGNLLPGGQLMLSNDVENYPGVDAMTGPELMEKFRAQAERFGAHIVDEWAHNLDLSSRPFKVTVGDAPILADSIIIATGASAKWLQLPEEDKFRNKGISACATCDGPLRIFRNKHVYVVGGGDTAMEEALFLAKFASRVTVVHRRDKLRASAIMQEKARQHDKIDFLWNHVITGYLGDELLTGLRLRDTETQEEHEVAASGLFMGIGHTPTTKFLEGTGVELDAHGYIRVRNHVYCSIDGVFACGDVHDTHFRQAVTAAGFGCQAAITAERWLEMQPNL